MALLAGVATGISDVVTLLASRGRIGEHGQLFGGPDPLAQQLQLALHIVETTFCGRELRAELLGLAPQPPGPRAEVDARAHEQRHPDHHPPPHEARPYPFAGVDPAEPAYAPSATRA